jgi:hypothetical protein
MNLRGAAGGAAPRQAGRMPAGRRSPTRRAKAVTPHLAGSARYPAARLPGNLTPRSPGAADRDPHRLGRRDVFRAHAVSAPNSATTRVPYRRPFAAAMAWSTVW